MSLRTIREIGRHFLRIDRWFLIPFLVILVVLGVLLVATNGAAYVAPFVYSLF